MMGQPRCLGLERADLKFLGGYSRESPHGFSGQCNAWALLRLSSSARPQKARSFRFKPAGPPKILLMHLAIVIVDIAQMHCLLD